MNTLLVTISFLSIFMCLVSTHPEPITFIQDGSAAKDNLYAVIIFALAREGDHRGALGGGAILSKRYILTAAHLCTKAEQFLIGYGSLEVTKVKRITARSALVHSSYNPTTLENDVAVITLPTDQQIDLNVAVAVSLAKFPGRAGTRGVIASFGFTSDDAVVISDKMMLAHQTVVKNSGCEAAFSRPVHRNQFCGINTVPEGDTNPPKEGSASHGSNASGDGHTSDEGKTSGNDSDSAGNGGDVNTHNTVGVADTASNTSDLSASMGDLPDGGFLGMSWNRALRNSRLPILSSVCNGDTGSALVRKKGDKYIAFGILSRVPGGCNDERPALYTQISAFSNWIKDVSAGQAVISDSVINDA